MLQKNEKNFLCFCVDPLFVGAPVRPNMLNMPKSASTPTPLGPYGCCAYAVHSVAAVPVVLLTLSLI